MPELPDVEVLRRDVDAPAFAELVGSRRGTIKSALMNQHVLAGLGNVYVDEILFQAAIHPRSPARGLSRDELDRVHAAMRRVIDDAVGHRADPDRLPRDWLLPHREPGRACPRCEQGRLERLEVSGRATYCCPEHQPMVGADGSGSASHGS